MSQLQPIDQSAGETPAQVSTGFISLQYAYNLLQRGLERFQTTGELFSEEELATLGYFQEKMVLSESESRLITQSRDHLDRHQKQQKWLVASALLFTLALLLTPGWKWLLSAPAADAAAPARANMLKQPAIQSDIAKLPVGAKVNVAPGEEKPESPAKEPAREVPSPKLIPVEKAIFSPASGSSPEAGVAAPRKDPVPATAPASAPPKAAAQKYDQQVKSGKVILVRQGDKWGMTDGQGRLLLPIRYDAIRSFSQDGELLQIKKGEQRGIATEEGTILLHPYFDRFSTYYAEEGLIIVVNQGKYAVYSRKESNFTLDFEYDEICCYSEGLFGVRIGASEWSFVDRNGQRAIDATFDAIEKPFADDRALVRDGKDRFYIDKTGRKLSSWP